MLTDRQLVVFRAIIDDFIASAQPVGSRAISEKENIKVSSATIRNIMAELEEIGVLEKTHSSSGRIPSEKGYRYYVDHVIQPSIIQNDEVDVIRHLLQDGIVEFEQIVQMSAEVLSELTSYTSIILGPQMFETKLKQLQIVPLSKHSAVAILVTNTGHVEHRSFTIPEAYNISDLEKLVNILNDRLAGVPMVQLSTKLDNEFLLLLQQHIRDVDASFYYLKEVLLYDQPSKLYIGGKKNVLRQPEFHDVKKLYSFYSMMENEQEIIRLLTSEKEGIKVTIGNENKMEAIKDFSLITATYSFGHDDLGTIGLLGPTRMEYQKVIPLLQALSEEITDALYMFHNKYS
ncbi:MAG TPA: heat-inducible transcriptional repressor HrcA [Bacillota bacterium]|nr:heat-inducible transcriptional repressor HrcA [Bacillota bacterium]